LAASRYLKDVHSLPIYRLSVLLLVPDNGVNYT